MAKEGGETLTNKRSEAPTLLDAEVPSSKRLTTSADLSSLPPQVDEPPRSVAPAASDNITESPAPVEDLMPDPYELSESDTIDDEPYEGAIIFTYKTMFVDDTKGLKKAIDAKVEDIRKLNQDPEFVFDKLFISQKRFQMHSKALMEVCWYTDGVAAFSCVPLPTK